MTNPIEIIKAHPTASIVAIVVVIGAVLLLSGGSGDGEYVDATYSDQSAAIAYAQYQAQQQGQALVVGAQKEVSLAELAASKYVADLEAQTRAAEIAASLELGKETLARNAASTDLANTLSAKIAGDQIAAQKAASDAQYATLAAQIKSQADIALASVKAQVDVAAINKPKRGLFSKIFG